MLGIISVVKELLGILPYLYYFLEEPIRLGSLTLLSVPEVVKQKKVGY